MSLGLKLLPIDDDDHGSGFSHAVLTVDNARKWESALENVRLTAVPDSFNTYVCQDDTHDEETHYGNTQETPYGEPLRAARVEDILDCVDRLEDWRGRDAAAIGYLRACDPRMKIALYWC